MSATHPVRAPILVLALALCALAPEAANSAGTGGGAAPFLPPGDAILAALDLHPALSRARADLAGAQARSRGLQAGEYETTVATTLDDRWLKGEGSVAEYSVSLSRGFRLPGKARLDGEAGRFGEEAAAHAMGDAMQQASLVLLERWMSWLKAEAMRGIDQAEAESYRREVASLRRRVEQKDAALLDLEQVQAAEARARMASTQSDGAAVAARDDLQSGFPTLALPKPPEIAPPAAPCRPFAQWEDLILSRNAGIASARAEAEREEALAKRARLDQWPDPTLGVRTFDERGGRETGFGFFVSIPIPGSYRSATADRQAAAAAAASADLERVTGDVRRHARRDVAEAETGLLAWTQAREALSAAEAAERRVRRAYELGQRDLTEFLIAERQVFEARRAELSARAAAQTALLRLSLDARELWLAEKSG